MNKLMCLVLVLMFSSCGDSAKKGGKTNPSTCGNGIVDSGEKCDSAIGSGDGACVETCAAPACSTATLAGSRETCDAECVIEPIACQNDDGCCPLGCDSQSDSDCTNTCGNAVVEMPELCDGDCPTQCNSDDVCAVSTLEGSGENCSARCEISTIDACVNGDGCCPSNCTAETDSDCEAATSCGNGIVEEPEACDGDCPDACSDNDACSTDQLIGSADTCSARCVFEKIDSCISNDGCCPPGCTDDNDSDCDPQCGNGVVDGDEICDGNCPSACDDSQVCTTDRLIGSPTTCNSECSYTTISSCTNDDGCCPNNCEFANDNDCACVPDTCNSLGLVCGNHPDGCGAMLNCGACTNGTCNNAGQCVGGMNGEIGDTCTDVNDCATPVGLVIPSCLADPGGYCSATCIPGFLDCPMGSTCNGLINGGECRKDCATSNDCRPLYSCVEIVPALGEAAMVCLPD